jgi:very-short-patch-repair endonuclease
VNAAGNARRRPSEVPPCPRWGDQDGSCRTQTRQGRVVGRQGLSRACGRWRRLTPLDKQRSWAAREAPTPAELAAWQVVRNHALGWKFRFQHVIGHYRADLYCHQARLVVEIDGLVHLSQQEKDRERTDCLKSLGLRVVRFTNEEVLADPEGFARELRQVLSEQAQALGSCAEVGRRTRLPAARPSAGDKGGYGAKREPGARPNS